MKLFNKSSGLQKETELAIHQMVAFLAQHDFVSVTRKSPAEVEQAVSEKAHEILVVTPQWLKAELTASIKELRED